MWSLHNNCHVTLTSISWQFDFTTLWWFCFVFIFSSVTYSKIFWYLNSFFLYWSMHVHQLHCVHHTPVWDGCCHKAVHRSHVVPSILCRVGWTLESFSFYCVSVICSRYPVSLSVWLLLLMTTWPDPKEMLLFSGCEANLMNFWYWL